ncbi:MAG: GNAT family N-acetyltransferase, partial [Gorillibacterium sp.]|nr:GNAT family N-acetyltransferase [Gorillibacterium sp.]
EPTVFYICHPYGMSLLFGNTENEDFNKNLYAYIMNENKVRVKNEWLQVYPEDWNTKIEELLGNRLMKKTGHSFGQVTTPFSTVGNVSSVSNLRDHNLTSPPVPDSAQVSENVRVNFSFNQDKYKQAIARKPAHEHKIVRTTQEMALTMPGTVTPKCYWPFDDEHDLQVGVGFSLLYEGEVASTAFSSFQIDKYLEIGIETVAAHRGKGYAFDVCCAIIDYCLEQGLEPVWGCRLENQSSYYLALSLGFEPIFTIPYYLLVV